MMQSLKGRDLLTLADLTPEEITHVLDVAGQGPDEWPRFDGAVAGLIFMKPSLRTRVSFETGCVQLGVHPVVMGPYDAFSRDEIVHDTVKVLERYVDLIVLRTFAQSHIEEVAEHASVPVINALTDDHHPCQGLADLLTIRQHKGSLAALKLAYVGDGNNMAHTYLLAGRSPAWRWLSPRLPDTRLTRPSWSRRGPSPSATVPALVSRSVMTSCGRGGCGCGGHRHLGVDGAGGRARAQAARLRRLHH